MWERGEIISQNESSESLEEKRTNELRLLMSHFAIGDYGDFGASTNTKNISSLIFLFFLHGTFFLVRNFFSFLCYTLFTSALYLYKLEEVFFLVAFNDWFFYTTFLLYIFCRYLPCSYIHSLNILLVIISYSHVHLPRRHLRFWSCYFLVSLRNHSIHYR